MKAEAWDVPNPEKTSSFSKKPKTRQAYSGEVACQLRDLRKAAGYRTPRDAANEAHINVSYLNRLEGNGRLRLSDHMNKLRYGRTIAALAFIYDVKPEDILTRPLEPSD